MIYLDLDCLIKKKTLWHKIIDNHFYMSDSKIWYRILNLDLVNNNKNVYTNYNLIIQSQSDLKLYRIKCNLVKISNKGLCDAINIYIRIIDMNIYNHNFQLGINNQNPSNSIHNINSRDKYYTELLYDYYELWNNQLLTGNSNIFIDRFRKLLQKFDIRTKYTDRQIEEIYIFSKPIKELPRELYETILFPFYDIRHLNLYEKELEYIFSNRNYLTNEEKKNYKLITKNIYNLYNSNEHNYNFINLFIQYKNKIERRKYKKNKHHNLQIQSKFIKFCKKEFDLTIECKNEKLQECRCYNEKFYKYFKKWLKQCKDKNMISGNITNKLCNKKIIELCIQYFILKTDIQNYLINQRLLQFHLNNYQDIQYIDEIQIPNYLKLNRIRNGGSIINQNFYEDYLFERFYQKNCMNKKDENTLLLNYQSNTIQSKKILKTLYKEYLLFDFYENYIYEYLLPYKKYSLKLKDKELSINMLIRPFPRKKTEDIWFQYNLIFYLFKN
jgi:hypothetical protein